MNSNKRSVDRSPRLGVGSWVKCKKIGDPRCISGFVRSLGTDGVFITNQETGGSIYFKYTEIVEQSGVGFWVKCKKIGDLSYTSGFVCSLGTDGVFITDPETGGSSYFKYNEIVDYKLSTGEG